MNIVSQLYDLNMTSKNNDILSLNYLKNSLTIF
ncbi:hypothetical protein DAD63_08965 [Streptococcus agalactiae]|uniref:Uncharacterized protein n=2 Tax=Streptococcus agalactiae TaxID=1311 RepID=Q8E277_STRA5|nr:hypothetical protein SAG0120 [Streptococcus agalactiae 2603V/R]AQY23424.1 hypothetical protein B1H24_00875 [Streptococcus agalactiae]ARC24076.1 hypothetical protein A6J68_01910 [Streptococcus sp. 'group B']AYY64642.1 hypothetical protein EGX70_07215 [Streptococcus sp. FDAARGOS_522]AYY69535.1 hypothetical protein EGX72_11510 [Streptococcus sp. FDAARGOS_521]AYZ04735.1 hypothetical protein EGX96_05835 [Streptococcus sp. FDAARGOS_520]EAO70555.1 conserved hypothetical protein [Streptococcus aga